MANSEMMSGAQRLCTDIVVMRLMHACRHKQTRLCSPACQITQSSSCMCMGMHWQYLRLSHGCTHQQFLTTVDSPRHADPFVC